MSLSTRNKVFLALGVSLAGLCGLGSLAFRKSDIGEAAANYDKNLAAFKAAGFVTTGAEFETRIKIPDSENAAKALGPLFTSNDSKFLTSDFPTGNVIPGSTRPTKGFKLHTLNDKERADLLAFLPKLKPALDKKKCVIDRDWSVPALALFGELARYKGAVKGLCALAKEDLDAGKTEQALERLKIAARISTWTDGDGTFVTVLTRCAILGIMERRLRSLLEEHSDNRAFLSGLAPILNEMDEPYRLNNVFIGEGLLAFSMLDALDKPTVLSLMEGYEKHAWTLSLGANNSTMKKAFGTRIMEVFLLGQSKAPKDENDIEGFRDAALEIDKNINKQGLSSTLVKLAVPEFGRSFESLLVERGNLNVVKQAVEAAKIRNATGAYPTKLPLDGKDAQDRVLRPGTPLRLDTSAGFRVWSVGKNKKDDGGVYESSDKKDDFGIALKK